MKKTLLLTTALIGTLSILGTAQAEIKVGGHVKTAWKSFEGFAAGARTNSGFSQERQIDFSSEGTLNNGLKYAAGFSMEQDAGETGFDGGEGNFVNVTSGNTTIELGVDHAPLNGDFNIVPRAGASMNDEIGAVGSSHTGNTTTFDTKMKYAQNLGTVKQSMGIAVQQKFTGGSVVVNFVPRSGDTLASGGAQTTSNTVTPDGTGDTQVSAETGKSAYEISYFGQPVAGLDLFLNYAEVAKNTADLQDAKTKGIGFAYTAGAVKFGAELVRADLATNAETETREYGIVYKISDVMTAGIGRTETEGKNAAGADEAAKEKVNYLQVGYNLGAIGTQLSYIDADNLSYVAASDSKALVLKVNTKF